VVRGFYLTPSPLPLTPKKSSRSPSPNSQGWGIAKKEMGCQGLLVLLAGLFIEIWANTLLSSRLLSLSRSFVSHSHRVKTRHPNLLRSDLTLASRTKFRFSFLRQYLTLDAGIVAWGQFRCR